MEIIKKVLIKYRVAAFLLISLLIVLVVARIIICNNLCVYQYLLAISIGAYTIKCIYYSAAKEYND